MKTTEYNKKAVDRQDILMAIILTLFFLCLVGVSMATDDPKGSKKKGKHKSKVVNKVYKDTYNLRNSPRTTTFYNRNTLQSDPVRLDYVDVDKTSFSFTKYLGTEVSEIYTSGSQELKHSLNINFSKDLYLLQVGTFFGNNGRVISGVNGVFRYNFLNHPNFSLYAYAQTIYDNKAKTMEILDGDNQNQSNISLSRIECYIGSGISKPIGSHVALNFSLGMGLCKTKVNDSVILPNDRKNINYQNKTFSISASFGISIKF